MDSVMEEFVGEKSRHDSEPYGGGGSDAEAAKNQRRYYRFRKPCADREHGVRGAMMRLMQWRCEGFEAMAQQSVNRVFDERPREQPEHKHREIEDHHQ